MTTVLTGVGWLVALLGATTMALAAVGLHRFADPAVRLHVAAKASSLGMLALLLGIGLVAPDWGVGLELSLTGLFLTVTVPLATHGLGRAIVDAQHGDTEETVVDPNR